MMIDGEMAHRSYRAPFHNDDLAPMKALRQLEVLDISYTRVTSDGLRHLQGLRTLRHLNLAGTQLGDEAVPYLTALTSLETLDLTDTKLSAEAVGTVRSKLAHTEVTFTPPSP
jgi:Leucine-rich repeat (LRR) protein